MTKKPSPILIAEWPRSARQTLRIQLDTFQGNSVVDIRAWYPSCDGLRPTRSGITIGTRHLGDLSEALCKALVEARKRKLVPKQDR
jgi:hypothetical protein